MTVLVVGGVWLGVELVGESGVWTWSLDEENPSFDEVGVESWSCFEYGCGEGVSLEESLLEPKVVMNERTGTRSDQKFAPAVWSGCALTARSAHLGLRLCSHTLRVGRKQRCGQIAR